MNPILAAVLIVVGVLLLVAVCLAVFLLLALRLRVPWAHRLLRRTNRNFANVYQLRTAGQKGATYAVLRHTGRVSGAERATPLGAVPIDGGFEIVLPYGPDTDWLKNLRAAGSAVLEHEGVAYRVHDPEVVPVAESTFGANGDASLRIFGTRETLRLRAEPA